MIVDQTCPSVVSTPEKSIQQTMSEKQKSEKFPSRYICLPNNCFTYAPETTDVLPAGVYSSFYDRNQDAYMPKKISTSHDECVHTNETTKKLIDQIETFWSSEEEYAKNKIMHKRGFLLVGKPGCGKTSIINTVCEHAIAQGAIVFIPDFKLEGMDARSCLTAIKTVEPNKKIVMILEDFESFIGDGCCSTLSSKWLNIMDGTDTVNNIIFLATSNYPEKIDTRFTTRPSRFDTIYTISPPTSDDREAYIKAKYPEYSVEYIQKVATDTKGLSYATLKELLVATSVYGLDYDVTLNKLLEIEDSVPTSEDFEEKIKMGFVSKSVSNSIRVVKNALNFSKTNKE